MGWILTPALLGFSVGGGVVGGGRTRRVVGGKAAAPPSVGGLPKHPRLLQMRLTYPVLCHNMHEVGSFRITSCNGSYQQPC